MQARVKRLVINPEAFVLIMQHDTAWRVSKGIPEGARLRHTSIDPYTGIIHIFIEHESFPYITLDTVAPIIETEFVKVI